jgi:putative transposase
MLLSYKYRLYPTRAQAAALTEMLSAFADLYNAGLQQRIEAYRRQGKSLGYADQANELKAVRLADERLSGFSYSAEQQILRRLDKTFRAFFRRLKAGDKPGFPRFRAAARFHSAEFRVGDGLTLKKSGRIGIVGIAGEIKVKRHRALLSDPASAILTRQGAKWHIVCHVKAPEAGRREGETVGIDCGLSSLVALSTGEMIPRPNWTKRAAKGLRRRQRALARAKRGSKRRIKTRARLAAYSARVARCRADFLHKLSADLVRRFAGIGIEDLNITGLARGMLAKDVLDAAWAQLIEMLRYKAARAGSEIIMVDPRCSSQACPECGTIKPKTLAEREHRCECGCVLDRDVASAQIVHLRAFGAGNRPSVAKLQVAAA